MFGDFAREVVVDVRASLSYHQRKERGLCTRPGCPERGDGGECDAHQRDSNARKRKAKRKAKQRALAARRAAKQLAKIHAKRRVCLTCGAKRVPGQKHCAKHLVANGVVSEMLGDKSVDKTARIRAATHVDRDGRSRYKGQTRRGQPKRNAIDAKDLGYALDALGRGTQGLALAAELETVALAKSERKAAEDEALAQLHQARGFIDDVLARHRYRLVETDPDD
jgi:hypothetical protein